MHLAFDLSYIHMDGRWRMPGSKVGRNFPDVGMYEEIARIAERGLFDMLFSGDGTGIPSTWRGSRDAAVKWGISWPRQEMSPLMTAMSRVTQHLGFGVTYSTTFMHPYYLARLLNSLDHVTGGRIAFNVITSTRRSDFQNYGFDDIMDHDARYDRMEEFIDVCRELWDSVESDAMIWDFDSGFVGDPAKVRSVDHRGHFLRFEVRSIHHPRRKAGPSCFRREVHREESEPPPMLPTWRLVPTCRWNCKFANALNWIVN
jgi:alkanesulfonate monooxygenase SsuD/methylene tetrahydromethanopterin reductase-like flavin-dependent oxidoreductase (luciferase family)